jgi:prepilin-type N-terminal cleavage/methylation domain-containing protein
MTLVELMVALVITGMALAAGYAALSTIIDRRMKTDTAMTDVARAAAVRRTIVDWLDHAQLRFTTGVPRSLSSLGSGLDQGDDELRFITTAPTPLHSDSTIVRIYVGTYGGSANSAAVQGLLADLTYSTSAMAGMVAAREGSAGGMSSNAGQLGRNPLNGASSGADAGYSAADTIVVPLDSAVTGVLIEYLIEEAGQQHWVLLSALTNLRGSGATLVAVRITLSSANSPALQSVLRPPIVVPVQMTL